MLKIRSHRSLVLATATRSKTVSISNAAPVIATIVSVIVLSDVDENIIVANRFSFNWRKCCTVRSNAFHLHMETTNAGKEMCDVFCIVNRTVSISNEKSTPTKRS